MQNATSKILQIHGVAVEVFGTGVLFQGDSGAGKSETAFQLMSRGHKLVADDAVLIENEGTAYLTARPHKLLEALLEVKGSGVINVVDLFGSNSYVPNVNIKLVFEFPNPEVLKGANGRPDQKEFVELAGVRTRCIDLPVGSAKKLAHVVENEVLAFEKSNPEAANRGIRPARISEKKRRLVFPENE